MQNVNITDIILLQTNSSDIALLYTDFQEGIWPFKNNAVLKLEIANGQGVEYCQKNFPFCNLTIKDAK